MFVPLDAGDGLAEFGPVVAPVGQNPWLGLPYPAAESIGVYLDRCSVFTS